MSEPVVIDISDDENEDWLRTVRKEAETREVADEAPPRRDPKKLAAFADKKK